MEIIEGGVLAADVEKVDKLRHNASEFMKILGTKIWTDFCIQSKFKLTLKESPIFPD